LRLGIIVPLATGVSENDDYQRACGRRETPLQGTDSLGSLPLYPLDNPLDIRPEDRDAVLRTPTGDERHIVYLGGPVS